MARSNASGSTPIPDLGVGWNAGAAFFVLGCEVREDSRMAAERSAAELERFLAERSDHLLRTAVLLTGSREAMRAARLSPTEALRTV